MTNKKALSYISTMKNAFSKVKDSLLEQVNANEKVSKASEASANKVVEEEKKKQQAIIETTKMLEEQSSALVQFLNTGAISPSIYEFVVSRLSTQLANNITRDKRNSIINNYAYDALDMMPKKRQQLTQANAFIDIVSGFNSGLYNNELRQLLMSQEQYKEYLYDTDKTLQQYEIDIAEQYRALENPISPSKAESIQRKIKSLENEKEAYLQGFLDEQMKLQISAFYPNRYKGSSSDFENMEGSALTAYEKAEANKAKWIKEETDKALQEIEKTKRQLERVNNYNPLDTYDPYYRVGKFQKDFDRSKNGKVSYIGEKPIKRQWLSDKPYYDMEIDDNSITYIRNNDVWNKQQQKAYLDYVNRHQNHIKNIDMQDLSSYGSMGDYFRNHMKDYYTKQQEKANVPPNNKITGEWLSMANYISNGFRSMANDVKMNMREMGNSVRTFASVVYSAIHIVQFLKNTMEISDSMTAIGHRLERYDNTGATKETLLNNAFKYAQNSRADIDSFGTLAQRILATNVTNGNAEEAMRLASLINKSMILGGSTAQEQKSAQLQLSQALASNILGGDELRAIRENAIGFTEMLAKGLTKGFAQGVFTNQEFANVQIGDLKGLGKKQLLTTDVVVKAIGLMEDEINSDFSKMPVLFSHTMNKLMNTFKKRLNEFNQEGKGLSRIVNAFDKLSNWIDSEKGKQIIDRLIEVLDNVIQRIIEQVELIGKALNFLSPILPNFASGVMLYKNMSMWSKLFLGSTDIYGNQRGGLFGRGGVVQIASQFFKGRQGGMSLGEAIVSSFGKTENINGIPMTLSGLILTIIGTIFKKKYYKNDALTASRDIISKYMSLGSRSVKVKNIIAELSDAGIDEAFLKQTLEDKGYEVGGYTGAQELLKNNVFAHLSSGAVQGGTQGAMASFFAKYASGGLIGKGTLMGAVTNPITIAIAAIYGLLKTWKHFDKEYEQKDRDAFEARLRGYKGFQELHEEDKSIFLEKALNEYTEKYNKWGKFIGGSISDVNESDIYNRFTLDVNSKRNEYLKKIQEGVNNIDSNTAGTLDITDEFIRNMRDIQTRSFRGQLLMGGNRNITGSWNVTIRNESDLQNISKQVEIALNEGVTNWANGNLNQVPV